MYIALYTAQLYTCVYIIYIYICEAYLNSELSMNAFYNIEYIIYYMYAAEPPEGGRGGAQPSHKQGGGGGDEDDSENMFSQPPGPSPIAPRHEMCRSGRTPHFDLYIYIYIPTPCVWMASQSCAWACE